MKCSGLTSTWRYTSSQHGPRRSEIDHWLNNAIWLTIGGIFYYRGILTAERDRELVRSAGNQVTNDLVNEIMRKGPMRLLDPRVIASAFVVSLSAWVGPFCGQTLRWALTMISCGAFVSTLTLPGESIPLGFKSPMAAAAMWLSKKLDVYLKTLVVGGICFLLLKIPFLGRFAHWYATEAFPVVEGSGSKVFEELLKTGTLLALIGLLLRITQVLTHGVLRCLLWLTSFSFVWISLQYEANEVLLVKTPLLSVSILFLGSVAFDLIDDALEAIIDSRSEQ